MKAHLRDDGLHLEPDSQEEREALSGFADVLERIKVIPPPGPELDEIDRLFIAYWWQCGVHLQPSNKEEHAALRGFFKMLDRVEVC